jgi:hypothetical protein
MYCNFPCRQSVTTFFTVLIIESHDYVATLTRQREDDVCRVGRSGSEGDTGTAVNSGNTSLSLCHANVATLP